jgi:hypothetical protein
MESSFLKLWKSHFEFAEFKCIWPVILMRRAQDSENFEDLVNLRVSCEQGSCLFQFSEDATCRPNVHSETVIWRVKKNFWAPIPQRYDFMRVRFNWEVESASKSEICDFESLPIFTDE